MASESGSRTANTSRTFGQWLRAMPRWKWVALLLALGAAVAGAIWMVMADGATAGAGGSGTGDLSTQFAPRGPGGADAPAASGDDDSTARGVFRLGFSFVAGFCIGAFVRTTLKVAAIAVGFWLLMTMLLAYFDLVVVDWNAIDSLWNRFTANVEREWGDFQRFMTGSLPAAGLGVAGLAVGLKKH